MRANSQDFRLGFVLLQNVHLWLTTRSASYFEDCKEHGQVSPGLDLSMCLALDHDAVSSLLEPVQGQAPWVWAVDVHHDFQTPDSAVQEYPGYFKVAISSLIPDLYPMLAGPHMQPRELWPLAKPISMSAVG